MNDSDPTKPKRRRYQFSLRTRRNSDWLSKEHVMRPRRAWALPVGLLLVVGALSCGAKPEPGVEVEAVAEPEPVAEEAKQSRPRPESGRDAAIAEIERLGGRVYRYDEESAERPRVGVSLVGS